jgi:hypothetical protein
MDEVKVASNTVIGYWLVMVGPNLEIPSLKSKR